MRLSLETLVQANATARRPDFDIAGLRVGVAHLGLGAFHRAHQGVFTDDAIEQSGGDWGIVSVSMRKPDVAETLAAQDGLYTVELLDTIRRYRVIGSVRRTLTLPTQGQAVIDVLAAATTHVATLTVTEKGYCLEPDGELDMSHPDIVHDLANANTPKTAIGVLAQGLAERRRRGGAPMTVLSCDNLAQNGLRLKRVVQGFADRIEPGLADWIRAEIAFPQTMVDSIVPASNAESLERADAALGLHDLGAVQREAFAQWVIEDRFSGPHPAWERCGVEITPDVAAYRRLKLHVLNAAHSALAYLGLARSHVFVRQAIADPEISGFLDSMMEQEIAPTLPTLPVLSYWRTSRERFANPLLDHRLEQIAQDGAYKLAERIYPLMIQSVIEGRPVERLACVVRAWLRYANLDPQAALEDGRTFPEAFRALSGLRTAILGSAA